MADVIRKSTNRFTKGLVMDFSPENTKNEVLTHALNATLLTFNGNELSLQNDMGNARVETAYLPEGYMPVGTCEYGGIIYIVSYNPLEDKSQIGCFPSPERNLSSDEIGIPKAEISIGDFQNVVEGVLDGTINNNTKHVLLKNDNLNPGDKFIVCADPNIYNERLEDLWVKEDSDYRLIDHPILALNVVSIEDSGKIIYLNSDIRQYTKNVSDVSYKYHILGDMGQNEGIYDQSALDIDSYRDVLNSGFSVFKSKTSGKLAILAELIMIDSYSVTHSIEPRKNSDNSTVEGVFDVIIHMDIEPKVTAENYTQVPKLQYYYLKNSQGYIQVAEPDSANTSIYLKLSDNNWVKPLYLYKDGVLTDELNTNFAETLLTSIKTATDPSINLSGTLGSTGKFNFPKPYSYHGRMIDYEGPVTDSELTSKKVYTKFTEGKYHRLKKSQVEENYSYYIKDVQAKFYKYTGKSESYSPVPEDYQLDDTYSYYIKVIVPEYKDAERNPTYKDNTLYKQVTFPEEASDEVLVDTSIEKWIEETNTAYIPLSLEEANNTPTDQLRILTDSGYSDYIEYPLVSSIQYYRVETSTKWISLGFGEIDRNTYPDKTILYYPSSIEYVDVSDPAELEAYWDLKTYDATHPCWGYKELVFYAIPHEKYELATEEIKLNFKDNPKEVELFYRSDYEYIDPMHFDDYTTEEATHPLFMTVPMDTYVTSSRFIANESYNYIYGHEKPIGVGEPEEGYYNEGPIYLYTVADFIPSNLTEDGSGLKYESLRLGNIKLPGVAVVNGFDIPFQYQYTVVPCMNYGRLDHLAVSNTVDFSKLHNFNQSNFNTWKYHIDGDQLRLTFGADIYDTYETDKVDGLFLEFYDAWGFAGSLEITDKKSYSGIFTKVISLNSLGALNKTRVIGSNLYSSFKRNVNITEARDSKGNVINDSFRLNGNAVTYKSDSIGWDIKEEDNDCGTLYSNLVYGVKTYIRRTKNSENRTEYIPKKEFFLYTLPIYNDYYYSVNDFSTITNPKLDLVLTYKLQDSGTKSTYTGNNIVNGYNTKDDENISKYISGTYTDASTLDVVKYYKYSGTSKLYLEVGLKKEYEDFNLSYDPAINQQFTCTLNLTGEDSELLPYSVKFPDSNITSPEQVLEYNRDPENPLTMSVNNFGFGEAPGDSNYMSEIIADTNDTMFINGDGKTPIPINYEFVVGYKANITNIHETEVQTTTVCALCHKGLDDEYNYEDFGIYKNDAGQFLSKAMFYNGGTALNEVFGVCKQVNTAGEVPMVQQCSSYDLVQNDSQDSKLPRVLNSGEPLRQMLKHIGKLTFCQPHAHAIRENEGVNIFDYNNDGALGISPNETGFVGDPSGSFNKVKDNGHGIVAVDHLSTKPKYNLSLNTRGAIDHQSEFVSTIHREVTKDYLLAFDDDSRRVPKVSNGEYSMRKYVGFSGEQVAKFNAALIETMKGVYAYNPDYDSFTVWAGTADVEDKQISFSSNIVSSNAKLNLDGTFNDYIYLGSIKFSNYLKYLTRYSNENDTSRIKTHKNSSPLEQLTLTPGLDYCGPTNSHYLVTSLTYNVPVPNDLTSELEFKSSKNLMIKHENGKVQFLEGTPNKKTLYGFNSELGKLIQLDVSNYSIDNNGKLTLTDSIVQGEWNESLDLSNVKLVPSNISGSHSFRLDLATEEETVSLNLKFTASIYSNIIKIEGNKIYVALNGIPSRGNSVTINSYINEYSDKNYSYPVNIMSVNYSCTGKLLNPDKVAISGSTSNRPNLDQQSADTLHKLVSNTTYNVELKGATGSPFTSLNTNLWAGNDGGGQVYQTNSGSTSPNYAFRTYGVDAIELYEIELKSINFNIKRKSSIENNPNTIIKVAKTKNYYNLKDHLYEVTSNKRTRLVGTSLTLNDLIYDGTSPEHRLYVRDDCYNNDESDYRNIIYYRSLDDTSEWGLTYQHRNHLYLQTGPCFTTDNI